MSVWYSSQLNRIEMMLIALIGKENSMSTALADLQASVANLTSVAGNAVALLNQLAASQKAAGVLPADVEAQVTAINAQVAALGAAVTADTPPTTP